MKELAQKFKPHHFVYVLAGGFLLFGALSFNPLAGGQPFFNNTDNFVLFADRGITLEQETQVSSGDLGSNNKLDIQKDNIINSNLFAKEITIDKDTTINGNASFNKINLKKESEILGTTTSSVNLPIADLPDIPEFPIGAQGFVFRGENNALEPGSYQDILLEKDARLVLVGGTYNLRKLELKENSVLVYSSTTTLNVKQELKTRQHIAVLPGQNLASDDLQINFPDEKPVHFGSDSFLNFKLRAPNANVKLGERTTFRGQVLAREIKVNKNSILSRDSSVVLQPKLEDLIKTEEGERLVVNQIIIQLTAEGTPEDAFEIAVFINGNIVGTIPSINLYQIAVRTATFAELENAIQQIKNQQNPKIKNVSKNNIMNLIQ